jgi:hypothetical protein
MQACPLGEGKGRLRCWSVECSLWVLGLRALVCGFVWVFFLVSLSALYGFRVEGSSLRTFDC